MIPGADHAMGLSCDEICEVWNIPPLVSIHKPQTGTIHKIFLLTSRNGRYVLRAYRYPPEKRFRIVNEHAIARFAQSSHLPSLAPFPLTGGEKTFLERNGHFYALYPFAQGEQISRAVLNSRPYPVEIISAMGRFLAEMQLVLASYPLRKVQPLALVVDRQKTIANIEELETVILAKDVRDDVDQQALHQLRMRKQYLLHADDVDLSKLEALPVQALHGDYQETNLFFQNGTVSSIIDWDQACAAPRSWEVIRTLYYVFGLSIDPCKRFLESYREVYPISMEVLILTANIYAWVQANNLWMWRAYYLDHNQSLRQLLGTSDSHLFEARWTKLIQALSSIRQSAFFR